MLHWDCTMWRIITVQSCFILAYHPYIYSAFVLWLMSLLHWNTVTARLAANDSTVEWQPIRGENTKVAFHPCGSHIVYIDIINLSPHALENQPFIRNWTGFIGPLYMHKNWSYVGHVGRENIILNKPICTYWCTSSNPLPLPLHDPAPFACFSSPFLKLISVH